MFRGYSGRIREVAPVAELCFRCYRDRGEMEAEYHYYCHWWYFGDEDDDQGNGSGMVVQSSRRGTVDVSAYRVKRLFQKSVQWWCKRSNRTAVVSSWYAAS